ncbi:MAG TPA: class C beta-lactamase-related serine hydrolase, partial [Candidatus Marinimicrobia bacterium]|nr:class C beta-lactamase-related serine hydrolase [Candidatus Neomarinimicrobiota bacterium]
HDILSMKDVLDLVVRFKDERKFSAGEKFKYSNTGYVLLAYLVEQVSGQSFESFLDQEIFEPLNMQNSSVWNLNTSPGKLPNRVQGTNNKKLNDYTWLDGVAGDGAVFVSIEDFINWDRGLANRTLVSDSTFSEAISPYVTTKGDTSYYGFGWNLSKDGKDMDHTGGWVGALTYIYINPESGMLFVLLDSSTNRNMRKIRKTIGDVLAGKLK